MLVDGEHKQNQSETFEFGVVGLSMDLSLQVVMVFTGTMVVRVGQDNQTLNVQLENISMK